MIIALRSEAPELTINTISGGGRYLQTSWLNMAESLGAFATLRKPLELGAVLDTVNRAHVRRRL